MKISSSISAGQWIYADWEHFVWIKSISVSQSAFRIIKDIQLCQLVFKVNQFLM